MHSGIIHELPRPSRQLCESGRARFQPSRELERFAREAIILDDPDDRSPLWNPDHGHLEYARVGFLYTNVEDSKFGRTTYGTCQYVQLNGKPWKVARETIELERWFGRWWEGELPHFVITLFAPFCLTCTEGEFLALLDHELYHAGHKPNRWGLPDYEKNGQPKFYCRPHAVEEFPGVVRRYGAAASGPETVELVKAGMLEPEITPATVRQYCGT